MKRINKTIVINAARLGLKGAKAKTPVHIHYDFYEADKRRDKMNVFSYADKVIEDALQDIGFIPNDGWDEVENTSHNFYIDKQNPRIEVTITEVETGD